MLQFSDFFATFFSYNSSNMKMDEKKLLEDLKKGSREALAQLWSLHSKSVLNLAFQMLKGRDSAEDILMDVFASVPARVRGFRGDSSFSTWLYRITVNECLMKLRQEKRHRELEKLNHDVIVEECLSSAEPVFEDGEVLQAALAELSAETRSMLWLKDAEGSSIEDLADIYGLPSGTIKAKLSRARAVLRSLLKEKMQHA